MCGISGFNWKDEALGRKMSECLKHRGPDASGVFAEEGVTLAHRRLAIIDLSPEANQPLAGGNLSIVFNGEIYNYKELKGELEASHQFKTQSDTEVILAGYEAWGEGVVKRLNGIFAFAIWDGTRRKLFLARDHMGVKPLYYSWQDDKFIFASEVKSILAHDISRQIDIEAFNEYLRVLYVPEPRTMLKAVKKLPPGSTLSLEGGKLEINKYYAPQVRVEDVPYAEAVERVRKAVEEAAVRQLVADVPVGVYLSGGFDSSAVLASVAKAKKNVKTFSVGFELEEEEEKEKFNRDFELAAETARHFGAEHYPLTVSAKDVTENLERVIGSLDDPISNPTAIPMALLSAFAKKEVTVVLSGNGGDELFGGYERYRMSRRIDAIGKIPGAKYLLPQRIRAALEMSALERLAKFEFEKDTRLKPIIAPRYWKPMSKVTADFERFVDATGDKTRDLMLADLKLWLPDQALLLGDKMSMLGSLEERVPLLDREVAELALSLPTRFLATPFATKKILKDAFRGILPEALYKEPKRGWFSPGAKWLRRPEIQAIARRVVSEQYYDGTKDLFDWKGVGKMLADHIEKREYNLTILWMILTFQIWAKANKAVV